MFLQSEHKKACTLFSNTQTHIVMVGLSYNKGYRNQEELTLINKINIFRKLNMKLHILYE